MIIPVQHIQAISALNNIGGNNSKNEPPNRPDLQTAKELEDATLRFSRVLADATVALEGKDIREIMRRWGD